LSGVFLDHSRIFPAPDTHPGSLPCEDISSDYKMRKPIAILLKALHNVNRLIRTVQVPHRVDSQAASARKSLWLVPSATGISQNLLRIDASAHPSRSPHKEKLPGLNKVSRMNSIDVGAARKAGGIESNFMNACLLLSLDESRHELAKRIENS
jgi:hypothetical protein